MAAARAEIASLENILLVLCEQLISNLRMAVVWLGCGCDVDERRDGSWSRLS